MHNLKLMTILLLLYAFLSQCSDSSTEPPIEYGKVKLIAETTAASFVRLKLEITSEQTYDAFRVERNGNSVKESDITGTDTVFYDGGLEPQSAYNYKAFLLKNGRQIDTSATLTVTTTGATSHDFTWRVDTLGVGFYGNELQDVTVINDNTVYAGGVIYTDEEDTVWNTELKRNNLLKWDGSVFTFEQIPMIGYDGFVSILRINSVFSLNHSNFWITGWTGSLGYWNGQVWYTEYLEPDMRKGGLIKIWAGSLNNIFIVGTNGSITKCDGTKLSQMDSGTEQDL